MAWEVELTTTGGLMERGIGGIRLRSSGEVIAGSGFELDCRKQLDEATVSRIDREVSASRPEQWSASYISAVDQAKAMHSINYRLRFRREGPRPASYETTWTELDVKRLPASLAKLMDDLNELKTSIVASCK